MLRFFIRCQALFTDSVSRNPILHHQAMANLMQASFLMGRKKAILQSEFPYNISSRCINKEWFNLPMTQVWEIFTEELYITNKLHNLVIHQFVLMNNHYHMIVSTPDSNISQCMHRFLGNVSRRLNESGNRINENFAGRHFKSILTTHSSYLNVYKYNYQNPVRAGICMRAEDYSYSSLNGLLGQSKIQFPMVHDETLFSDPESTLDWLAKIPSKEKLDAIRWGLKRPYFISKKDRNTGKPILGEGEVI